MSLTLTLNGTLGKSTSSDARAVMKTIAAATPECQGEESAHYFLRKNAVGIANTGFPIYVPFGQVNIALALYIRVVNDVLMRFWSANNRYVDINLGGPEGTFILFGTPIYGITLLSTTTDQSEVDIYIAGTTDIPSTGEPAPPPDNLSIYYGENVYSSLTSQDITSLRVKNNDSSNGAMDYAFVSFAYGYKYICMPVSFGLKTQFTDVDTSIAVAMEDPVVVSVTDPDNIQPVTSYHVYRSTNLLSGAMLIRVAA